MIKSGGENVACARVESVVGLHPSVSRVAVIGVPDERWGEMVVAVIVLSPGSVVDETEVIGFCR